MASTAVLPYGDKFPQIPEGTFLAPGVCITGDVQLGPQVSFWCNAVARGDVNLIRIGRETNIQDLCVLHVTEETPLLIGEQVTVGHNAILHGCTIGNRCLIGMGSIILDRAVIGDECLIGAGTLITERTEIPAGSLVVGSPGKVKRALTPEERALLKSGAEHYRKYAATYMATPGVRDRLGGNR